MRAIAERAREPFWYQRMAGAQQTGHRRFLPAPFSRWDLRNRSACLCSWTSARVRIPGPAFALEEVLPSNSLVRQFQGGATPSRRSAGRTMLLNSPLGSSSHVGEEPAIVYRLRKRGMTGVVGPNPHPRGRGARLARRRRRRCNFGDAAHGAGARAALADQYDFAPLGFARLEPRLPSGTSTSPGVHSKQHGPIMPAALAPGSWYGDRSQDGLDLIQPTAK